MKVIQNALKILYSIQCYLLLLITITFIFFLLYSKFVFGNVLYYGNENNFPKENYLWVLFPFYSIAIFALLVWFFSTFFYTISGKYKIAEYTNKIGLVGFILNMILFITDPFGFWKYLDT